LTRNIGFGEDATHTFQTNPNAKSQKFVDYIKVERIQLKESDIIHRALANYFKKSLWQILKDNMKSLLRVRLIKDKIKKVYDKYSDWKGRSPSTRNFGLIKYHIKKKNIFKYLFNSNFDSSFYKEHEDLRNGYDEIAKTIIEFTEIKSACDFGCGNGYVISYLKNEGITVLGLDGSKDVLKIADKSIVDHIRIADFRQLQNFGTYDLVISMEVAEHLKDRYSKVFIENLIKHSTKYIIFSAALPGQWGEGHINCRPREFWIKIFQDCGWHYDPVATESFKNVMHDNKTITKYLPWLIDNFSLFKISKQVDYSYSKPIII
jgi:2-polyprenyl-3-methyl-5-hydroxy-6-metoxy-1,4-benzoquinol methylase